jgi:hypothetical protein
MPESSGSFGRRGPPAQPEPASSAPSGPVDVDTSDVTWGKDPPFRGLGLFIVGLLVLLAVRTAHTVLRKQMGHISAQGFEDSYGYPTLGRALTRIKSPTPELVAVDRSCQALARASGNERAARLDKTLPHGVAAGEVKLLSSAGFIQCLTQSAPQRLCNGADREHLSAAVADYVLLRRKVGEKVVRGPHQPGGGQVGSLPAVTDSRLPHEGLDPAVAQSLRSAVQGGYVPAGLFGGFMGWGMPPELKSALHGVRGRAQRCS